MNKLQKEFLAGAGIWVLSVLGLTGMLLVVKEFFGDEMAVMTFAVSVILGLLLGGIKCYRDAGRYRGGGG
ncbi:MAG: hypothetical protein OXJ64_15060 [Boseongicola sp.]|nr:hypothetical protein [Boseongicola sp.]